MATASRGFPITYSEYLENVTVGTIALEFISSPVETEDNFLRARIVFRVPHPHDDEYAVLRKNGSFSFGMAWREKLRFSLPHCPGDRGLLRQSDAHWLGLGTRADIPSVNPL